MAGVLTEASTVACGHGGSVSTTGAAKLTVDGKGVMLDSLAGTTDGRPSVPPPTAEAVQTKLTAI